MTIEHDFWTEHTRRQQEAVRGFIAAFRSADMERLLDAFRAMGHSLPWAKLMRAVAKSPVPPERFRQFFLDHWRHNGEHIRQEVGDDLLLADALRVMLPSYTGPAITLYRGDGFRNRKYRTYGLSWSRDVEIARGFAEDWFWRTTLGGSVLLEATAPADAIICEVSNADDSYGEHEIIVDRRRLRTVKVIKRFTQIPCDQFQTEQPIIDHHQDAPKGTG
jgi:hypothetical protein